MAIKNKREVQEGPTGSVATLDGYARLAAGVLIQAIIDSQSVDYAERIEAITWLASDEAQEYGALVGIRDVFAAWMAGVKIPEKLLRGNKHGWRIEEREYSGTKGYT